MATRNQIIEAVRTFIERDLLPRAETKTDRFALRGLSAALVLRPQIIPELIKRIPFLSILEIIDEAENYDVQFLREFIPATLGQDTVDMRYKVFPWDVKEYGFSLGAEDIKKIFTYM